MNRKADFFYKTNRFESIRITNRIESIRIANWNALVVSGVRRMNEVNARRARLVLGWMTVFGRVGYTISVGNQPTRSTSPGSLNRASASAGLRAGMSLLPGGR